MKETGLLHLGREQAVFCACSDSAQADEQFVAGPTTVGTPVCGIRSTEAKRLQQTGHDFGEPVELKTIHHKIHSDAHIADEMLVFGNSLPKAFISIHHVVLHFPKDNVVVEENAEPEE